MTPHILSLRVSRRAIGAAVLAGEVLTLADGRHLTSARHRAVPAAVRYVTRLVEQSGAMTVVLDASTPRDGTATKDVIDALKDVLAAHGIVQIAVAPPDLASAYGMPPMPTRSEIRQVVTDFWPELSRITSRVQPYAADAAAAALYAECYLALSPPSP